MKPFDLERALAGDPVITRNGHPVTQLVLFDAASEDSPLVGVIVQRVNSWTLKGACYADGRPSDHDLFMAPIKRKGWVNIYPSIAHQGRIAYSSDVYESKETANTIAGANCIGCAQVEWEE